jgi:hypothetical protein
VSKTTAMRAIEFSTEIKSNHTIEVPEAYAALLSPQQKVRVLLLLEEAEEEAGWNQLATEQFLQGYAKEDAVYDKL